MTNRFLTLAAPLLFLTASIAGCTKTGEGTFTISIGPVIREDVSAAPVTKAVSDEEIDTFIISVEGTSISGKYSEIKGREFTLPAGNYVVTAENLSEADAAPESGYGQARYTGSETFTVQALSMTQTVTVGCTVANAKVSASADESFTSVFDVASIKVTVAEDNAFSVRHLDILYPSPEGISSVSQPAWYSAGSSLYVRVSARKIGASETVSYMASAFVAEKAKSYKLTLTMSDSVSGGIEMVVGESSFTTGDILSVTAFELAPIVEDL
ncbi:MAG: DUF4493 domain-containing protein [Candidatus Cryptobacteroides sp.]